MVPQSRELIEDRSHYWLPSAHWKYHWGDDKCKLKTSNNRHSLLVLGGKVMMTVTKIHQQRTLREDRAWGRRGSWRVGGWEAERSPQGTPGIFLHTWFFFMHGFFWNIKKSIKPELVMTKHRNTWKTRPSPCVMTSSIATPLCWRKWLQLYRAVWPKGLKGPVILIKWGPVRTTRNWAPKQERGHNIW